MEALPEIVQFLNKSARIDLKAVTLTHILGLTGSKEGISLISKCSELLTKIIDLTEDDSETIRKDAILTLVNISAEENGAKALVAQFSEKVVHLAYSAIIDEDSKFADPWCMVLCNVTRPENLVKQVLDQILTIEFALEKLTTCFTRISYNKQKGHLNYLGPLFSNLSQSKRGLAVFCDPSTDLLTRILPFVHHEGSIVRRGGSVGLLKNVCFDSTLHEWLLGDGVEVLPYILLPLAGPEEFDEDTNDKLPVELQYLGPEKRREEDPDIRKMLIESLAQLCATRKGRNYLRERGTYEILRELHKFECGPDGDKRVLAACENVVDVLIRTEEEIGEDNLKNLEIPEDVVSKINVMNQDIQE
ncbi:protein HGH1 homolog [Toxorhynchites rutilus septentrionalis]|uniref:protein HGH1 homolog n=1 Tax=Toxorhynchites rutilus septentrionalis TaxID=329112 RepID=UPI00247A7AC0|nr:protein HGH1 homolog [Toxorhynchites rutilus septentrionalis]